MVPIPLKLALETVDVKGFADAWQLTQRFEVNDSVLESRPLSVQLTCSRFLS